MVRFN